MSQVVEVVQLFIAFASCYIAASVVDYVAAIRTELPYYKPD